MDSDRTRELMITAVRNCRVTGYEPLVDSVTLPDPDDRHVLAAAIKAGAQVVVTINLKDFPPATLADWALEAKHPDAFVLDQIYLNRAAVYGSIQRIADSYTSPPRTIHDILSRLEDLGLVESVAALRT